MVRLNQEYSSQFMRYLYEPVYFLDSDKQRLANTLYQKAVEHNPEISDLVKNAEELDSKLIHSSYSASSQFQQRVHALKARMEAGEIPIPTDFEGYNKISGEGVEAKIAGIMLELEKTHAKLDGAFKSFEESFFPTPEGVKFQEYIAAACRRDFTAFLKDHPPKVPRGAEAGATRQAENIVEQATEALSGSERNWVSKLFRNAEGGVHGGKVAAWSAGIVTAGAGIYALSHRKKEERRTEASSSAKTVG